MPNLYENYGILQALYDASPLEAITNAGQVIDHGAFPDEFARQFRKEYPDAGKRYDRSLADMAINYAGGYDWGARDAIDPQAARDMGKAYQYRDYLLGDDARKYDSEQDYLENLAGVEAGIAARGNRAPMEDLLKMAYEYALQKQGAK